MHSVMQSKLGQLGRLAAGLAILAFGAAPAAQACQYAIAVEAQSYMPYYKVQEGDYQGYARDLLDAFAESLGCHFIYRPLPVKRTDGGFLSGTLDFRFPDNPAWNTELKKDFHIAYSAPVIDFTDGMLVLPQHLGRGQAALRELGILLGFTPANYVQSVKTGEIALRQVQSTEALLRMGLIGRVDAVYLNPVVARRALAAMGRAEALRFDPELPHYTDYYYLSSLKHPQMLDRFNAFLRENGELQQALRRKYEL